MVGRVWEGVEGGGVPRSSGCERVDGMRCRLEAYAVYMHVDAVIFWVVLRIPPYAHKARCLVRAAVRGWMGCAAGLRHTPSTCT